MAARTAATPTIPTLRAPPLARLDADPVDTLLDPANSSLAFNGMPQLRFTRDRIDICYLPSYRWSGGTRAAYNQYFLVKSWAGAR